MDTNLDENIVRNESPSIGLIILLIIIIVASIAFLSLFIINFINFNNCKNENNAYICPSVNCPFGTKCCTKLEEEDCVGDEAGLPLCGDNPEMIPNDKNIITLNTCFYPYYGSSIKNLSTIRDKIEEQCVQKIKTTTSKGIFAYAWKKDKPYGEIEKEQ